MTELEPIDEEELVATERGAYVVYLLMRGKTLTTAEIAAELGTTQGAAWKIMQKVSRKVPVRHDLGFWCILNM